MFYLTWCVCVCKYKTNLLWKKLGRVQFRVCNERQCLEFGLFFFFTSIHPFSITASLWNEVTGVSWSLSQLLPCGQFDTLDKPLVCCRATWRQTAIYSLTHIYDQSSVSISLHIHVFLTVGGSRRTAREPKQSQTRKRHTNATLIALSFLPPCSATGWWTLF